MNSMEVLRKIQKVWTKMWTDPGNDMTIADSYKLLNIKKGSILDVATILDFRVLQISNTNPKYK